MSLSRISRITNKLVHQHQRLLTPYALSDVQQQRQVGLYQMYQNFLEKRFPRVYRLHRMVVDGCRSCGMDIKQCYVIGRDLKKGKRTVADLNEHELFAYIQCPPELYKLVLLLIILQFPGPGDLLILAAIFFPRYVLTRHFWSEDQKQKFWRQFYIESHRPRIEKLAEFACPKYTKSVPLTGDGLQNLKMPDLNDLDFKHLFYLFRLHNVSLLSGTNGLKRYAMLLAQLDKLTIEDKERIDNLSDIQLKNHLYVRRLDFQNKSTDEMKQLLHTWATDLKRLSNNPTVYLHAPLLLQTKR